METRMFSKVVALLTGNRERIKGIVSLVACTIVGLTFLASGIGKVLGVHETPAQLVDFVVSVIPGIFLTPPTVHFIFNILIPYVFPWAELILGFILLIGFVPRLAAVLCLPLVIAFIGSNIWAINQTSYVTCASCFGIWEDIFGELTPVQSLSIDLVLLTFALAIIFLHPGSFFSSRSWLVTLVDKSKPAFKNLMARTLGFVGRLWNQSGRLPMYIKEIGKTIKRHRRTAISAGIGIIGLALITYGVAVFYLGPVGQTGRSTTTVPTASQEPAPTAKETVTTESMPIVSDIIVSEVSETSAIISWTTDKLAISSIEVYTKDGSYADTLTDEELTVTHQIEVSGLLSANTYYFKILSGDEQSCSNEHSFITQPAVTSQEMIQDVEIAYTNNSTAVISWTTKTPSAAEVEYWLPTSKKRQRESTNELTTKHSITLGSLQPNTIYYYQIKSTDAGGNYDISPTLAMSPQIGARAPDFTLNSINGRSVTLSDYRGKLVMLDFWVWSCPVCREKMPIIQDVFSRMPSEMMAILCIHSGGNESVVRNYAESEDLLMLPILLDLDQTVTKLYNVTGLPTIFFIDHFGIIRLIDPEFSNAEELENIINTVLYSTPKSGGMIPPKSGG